MRQEPTPLLTRQQRQILRWLSLGDRLWEIAEDPDHYTVYNEKRGRDQRVRATLVRSLEEQGWIRKCPHGQADRLDCWEITPEGQALRPQPKVRHRRKDFSEDTSPSK